MANLFEKWNKARLIVFKEWKRKSNPIQTAQNVNASIEGYFICIETVNEWYQEFNNDDTDIFGQDFLLYVTSFQCGEQRKLVDSLLLLSRDDCQNQGALVKDGRFLIFPSYHFDSNQWSIVIYDLFQGTKKSTMISPNVLSMQFTLAGKYLLSLETFSNNSHKLYAFKINYNDLNVEELETVKVQGDFNCADILHDQLDSQRFVIHNCLKTMTGKIQDDQILLNEVKNLNKSYGHGTRFIDNSFQTFEYDTGNVVKSIAFCKLNLDTLEKEKTNVPIKLRHAELIVKPIFENSYCWSKNDYYHFFEMKNGYSQLLCFSSETLKWTDINICSRAPEKVFVDENEVLTIQTTDSVSSVFYRLPLRKPDKLMNLARLSAARELHLFGDEKYVKVSRQIQFKS